MPLSKDDYKSKMRDLLAINKWQEALDLGWEAIGRFPNDDWLKTLVLRAAAKQPKPSAEAVGIAESLIERVKQSGKPVPLPSLFRAALILGPEHADFTRLLAHFESQIESDEGATMMIARLLYLKGDVALAIDRAGARFDEIATPDKIDHDTGQKALAHFVKVGRDGDALTWGRSLVSKFPGNFRLMGLLLWAAERSLERSDDILSVAKDVLEAQSIDPGQVPPDVVHRALSYLDPETTLYQSGLADLRQRSTSDQAKLVLARQLARTGDWDQAKEILLPLSINNPAALRLLGAQFIWNGDWAQQSAVFERLSKIDDIPERERVLGDGIRAVLAAVSTNADLVGLPKPSFRGSPDLAIRAICSAPPILPLEEFTGPVVVICGSLGAGGAERITAQIVAGLHERHGSDVQLWLRRKEQEEDLFFLPLTGFTADQVVGFRDLAHDLVEQGGDHAMTAPGVMLHALRGALGTDAAALFNLFLRVKPRAVYAVMDHTMLSAGPAAVLAGVPNIVLHSHNMRPSSTATVASVTQGWPMAYRSLFRAPAVQFISVSEAARRDYFQWIEDEAADPTQPMDAAFAKSLTVHNGFEFGAFDITDTSPDVKEIRQSLDIPVEARVVGTAFRFTTVKRPDRWVEMAMILVERQPSMHFLMCGDGEMRQALMDQVAASQYADRFHFTGLVSDMPRVLRAMDMFVLTSSSEGLPNTLIEAQAVGVAVAAYDVGGIAETMLPGTTGLLVQEDTAEAMADTLDRALSDTSWLNTAKSAGPSFVRSSFSLKKQIDRVHDLLGG